MADLFSSSSSTTAAPTESSEEQRTHRVYNPYEALRTQHTAPLHQVIYDLPTSPEFLFSEEAGLHRRTWGHNLSFFAGLGFLSGGALGAAQGSLAGIRAGEPGESLKIRVNRVLNASGQAGARLGNRMGTLGMVFAGLESGICAATGSDGVLSTVAAGLGTGAVFKAASGPRSAAVAGAIGGLAAGIGVLGKHALKRYIPV